MLNKNIVRFLFVIFLVCYIFLNAGMQSYASAENNTITEEYQIMQSNENNFLNNIYNSETNTLKIVNIDKKVSDDNYQTKEIVETKELDSQDRNYINQVFGENKNYNDEEYAGELSITDIEVEVVNNGSYQEIDEKVLSFNNYTNNDLINIEKEITLNNTIYYLINVNWEVEKSENIDGEAVPITYKGTKIYQTIKTIQNPSTYNVTVTYSGTVEKIDTIYDYVITYEEQKEEIVQEESNNNIIPVMIISGLGLAILLISLLNIKNTYVYSKTSKGFKLIKRERLNDKNLLIDITNCKTKSKENIYAIKINKFAFSKLKGRTISLTLGNRKKDIILWNNYYEIKL